MQDSALLLADRYELGPVLGEGGMAKVHRAIDRTLDRPVAVKILAPPYDRDHGYVERFRREALAAARLNHPNIVTVFDSGEDAGTSFIVMELIEGETLGARLRRTGPMEPEEVVSVGAAVAAALAEAHARGVVHRDVKPGNVMLTEDGRVKVLDFGIARASGAEAVTRTGLVMGSASYLSPEQAQGASADERSDVYALGCVLFQMATGRAPFVADDPVAALYQHVNEPVPRPTDLRPVPAALEAVILRCLAKAPEDRYASAAELEAALLAAPLVPPDATEPLEPIGVAETAPIGAPVLDAQVTTARPAVAAAAATPTAPAPRAGSRRWLVIAVLAAILLALVAALALTDPFGPNLRREARRGRHAVAATPSAPAADAPAVTGDPQVDAAYAALVAAIGHAAADATDPRAADALEHHAQAIVDAYSNGDRARVDDEVRHLTDELGKRVASGEISSDDALSIADALGPLVLAIDAELPIDGATGSGVVTGPTHSGPAGEPHGPPAHSNAGGNGHGNGHDEG